MRPFRPFCGTVLKAQVLTLPEIMKIIAPGVVTTPFALVLMVAGNVNNWAFNTVPQKGLNGRIGYQPRGKGLGGSSAINAMVYIRGHKADYDQWAALGNTGWSFADVLPYFKRSEDNADFDGEYHG